MSWGELVTTALLGSVRRPLGTDHGEPWAPPRTGTDDAVRLLDLAAAHRTLAVIGNEPPESQPGQVAPEQQRPVAPDPAGRVLDRLLNPPDPALIGYWLQACVESSRTVAPVQWTALARAAARSTAYDRGLIGRALGERGRWFLRQNPEWRRLAADAMAGALTPPPPPHRSGAPSRLAVDALAANPELIFDQPDPWSAELVAAAWALIGSGSLGARAGTYAVGIGVRLPTELYPRLGEAARYYLEAPDASPSLRRTVRLSFVALERAAYARAEIAAAFSETDAGIERTEIPHV